MSGDVHIPSEVVKVLSRASYYGVRQDKLAASIPGMSEYNEFQFESLAAELKSRGVVRVHREGSNTGTGNWWWSYIPLEAGGK